MGGVGPPPDAGATPGAVTSDHTGGQLDFIRQAIMALQHFAEQTNDDVELAKVHKCIVGPLPPDHPIFSIGPSFVFKNDLPPEITPAADEDDDSSSQPSEGEGE